MGAECVFNGNFESMRSVAQFVKEKILILDGAMGTMIQLENPEEQDFRGERFQQHPFDLKGLNDILVLTQPSLIRKLHSQYLEAGADIITTNTFNANHYGLREYGVESLVYEINHKAADLARKIAEKFTRSNPAKPRFVAGSIGPTGKTASMSPDINNPAFRDVSFDSLSDAYELQAKGLTDAGVDLLLVETVFDTLNAKAALYAINKVLREQNKQIPVMISVTIDESGRSLSGQTVEAFYNSVIPFGVFSVGINCSFGADKMLPYLERLSVKSEVAVSAHPNAGLPNELGEYDQSPEMMASQVETFCENQFVNIAGGCCGSKPEHIQAIAEVVSGFVPRSFRTPSRTTRFSGLQSFGVKEKTPVVYIGERTNVSGSRKFARLIREEKYEEALDMARNQIQEGSRMLNINLDDGMIDAPEVVKVFLNHLQAEPDIVNVPVMIDSSDFNVLRNGLKCLQGRSGVNSISLKDGVEPFKKRAGELHSLGAVVVVMAFDEKGQADTFERKTEICHRAYQVLTREMNLPPEDIVFDPNVLTIGTGIEAHNNYAVDFIRSVEWIKQNLPYAKVNAGISNVSFAFRGNDALRDAINSVFLHHCEKAGLDFAIVHPAKIIPYGDIPENLLEPVEDLIFNRREDATDRLIELADEFRGKTKTNEDPDGWRELPPEERVGRAMQKGLTSHIHEDIEALKQRHEKALDIIQGPLMEGMNRVGELFGSGRMFLPQVIKSARFMNKAVELLKPDVERENLASAESSGQRKKVLLATVEGDVHDIGKNIVSLVLGCNNFEVKDLGVMVPKHRILQEIKDYRPDVLGLSGLISPSLDKMVEVLQMLDNEGLRLPVLLGGAATSSMHTAVKAAPQYSGFVMHVADAMQGVNVTNALCGKDADAYIKTAKQKQLEFRENYQRKRTAGSFLPLHEARKKRFVYQKDKQVKPRMIGIREFDGFDLHQLKKYIDWTPFFHGWGLKGKYPSIFEKDRVGSEAERLFKEALTMLDEIEEKALIRPRGVIGLFPANSDGDDVMIYENDQRKDVKMRIPMLRQQKLQQEGYTLSLADFVAPAGSGIKDYFGGFAVTTGLGIDKHLTALKQNGDSYNSIMFRLLADRLVEAAAEIMHEWVRKEYWGYEPEEKLGLEDLIRGKFKGIRPAVGYPACPDHQTKKHLFELLDAENRTGITLTEIYAMKPASSVSGFYLSNKAARYFGIGKIGKDQLEDYSRRAGQHIDQTKKWLYFAIDEE